MNSERSHDSVLIEAANKAYHRMEAGLYDDSHPEILWCEQKHWKSFLSAYVLGHDRPIRILDVGAGTGFLGRMCKDVLIANDAYIAVDLSNEMLQKLQTSLTGSLFAVETHVS